MEHFFAFSILGCLTIGILWYSIVVEVPSEDKLVRQGIAVSSEEVRKDVCRMLSTVRRKDWKVAAQEKQTAQAKQPELLCKICKHPIRSGAAYCYTCGVKV